MKKKIILLGSIGGIVVVIITIWALIAGVGFLQKQFPEWTKWGETIVRETIKKAEDAFNGTIEKAKESIAGADRKG